MSLEDKITDKNHPDLTKHLSVVPGTLHSFSRLIDVPWYLKREFLRMQEGVYPQPTETIVSLNRANGAYALHVSKDDATMVAYTPDKAYGEADRQVKTTLGKFLAKYYPNLADDHVAALAAEHLSELDTSFEIVRGQALVDVYTSNSLHSCMSKSDTPLPDGHHPAEVYDSPAISMAVLRDSEGRVNARCLILEGSKTYIRNYGDAKLLSKLKRSGYTPGGWEGVEFKHIETTRGSLLPYLDSFGAQGSPRGGCVALVDGKLLGVSQDVYLRLRSLIGCLAAVCATNTSGVQTFKPVKSAQFSISCAITGRAINTLLEEVFEYWDGVAVVKVCQEATFGLRPANAAIEGCVRTVLVDDTCPVFTRAALPYVDNAATRERYGYKQLDATLYPDLRGWYSQGVIHTSDEETILLEDAIYTPAARGWHVVHSSKVGKGWVKLHAETKGKLYYAPPGTAVVKTTTGRKVVVGAHAVATTWDGVTDFTRNLRRQYTMFGDVWRAKSTPQLSTDHAYFVSKSLEMFDAAQDKGYMVRRFLREGVGVYNTSHIRTPTDLRQHLVSYPRLASDVRTQAVLKAWELWEAEAEAYDYNSPPRPTVITATSDERFALAA